ncbi:MAG: asparagine synthase (glutamine-hydrolyzing) [Myxococcota bacterium]
MCGICGVVGPSRETGAGEIEAMARSLDHRGPDDRGVWRSPAGQSGAEAGVALGHTRLAVLDPSPRGHQPMHSEDGHTVLVYNGEIYNHRELRRELEVLGHRFRSSCDTEVVLEAYRQWKIHAFERFNGMFALAVWDCDAARLVLARDRMGIKPLHYRITDGGLSFASELHALRAQPSFRPSIDRAALNAYLRYGWIPGTQTIYADTYRLAPGTYLSWEHGRFSIEPYWRLSDHAPQRRAFEFDTCVEELEQILGDAVEARLIADVPLGAFLSGGVDSSAVVALLQERAGRRVRTFSIGFEEKTVDEAPWARAVAEHLGTDHTELYVGTREARRVAYELPTLYDEPHADPSAVPTVLLSRLARKSVTVALSGDGGDELFGGYPRYRKLERLLPFLRLPQQLDPLLQIAARWAPLSSLRNGLAKVVRANDEADLAESFHASFDDKLLARASGHSGGNSTLFQELFRSAPESSPLRRAMYAEARTYLCDNVLIKLDRATMSVGLEARVPLLDPRVVDFAFGLPTTALHHGGRLKAPLRALLDRRIPAALLDRPKQGFAFPIRTVLDRDLDEWIRTYLAPARLAEEGNLDPAAVVSMLSVARRGGPQAESEVWRLVCFQRWFAWTHRGEVDPQLAG